MSRIPSVSARNCIKGLQRAGFVRKSGTKKHLIFEDSNGKIVVVPNHRSIKPKTFGNILKQAGLTYEEFKQLI